MYTTHFDTCLA